MNSGKCPSCGYSSFRTKPFEVVIHIKHFDQTVCKSLHEVDSLGDAELIGLGMRHGVAMGILDVYSVDDLTATIESPIV